MSFVIYASLAHKPRRGVDHLVTLNGNVLRLRSNLFVPVTLCVCIDILVTIDSQLCANAFTELSVSVIVCWLRFLHLLLAACGSFSIHSLRIIFEFVVLLYYNSETVVAAAASVPVCVCVVSICVRTCVSYVCSVERLVSILYVKRNERKKKLFVVSLLTRQFI